MLAIGIVLVPLAVAAVAALALSNESSKGDPGSRGESYGSAACHGLTGGYKATRIDEVGRLQTSNAAGYWSI